MAGLYEVAILELPTKKDLEEGTGRTRLVLAPRPVIAEDQQAAAVLAVIESPGELNGIAKERMQILVRPFA